jgi:hypothetical protein
MKALLVPAAATAWVVALTSLATAQTCTPAWWVAANGLAPRQNWIVPLTFAEFDPDGPGPLSHSIYVGGFFNFNGGSGVSASIARWDGILWQGAATGLGGSGIDSVMDLVAWDPDGAGQQVPLLVAGGSFVTPDLQSSNGLGAWNGQQWSALGGGVNLTVFALAAHDFDGNGPRPAELIVGGRFNQAGNITAYSIARYDGTQWATLGGRVPTIPNETLTDNFTDLHSFDPDDDGVIPATLFGVRKGNEIVLWDGAAWVPTGPSGYSNSNFANGFAEVDHDGPGPESKRLYAVGNGLFLWNNGQWQKITNNAANAIGTFDPDGPGPVRAVVVAPIAQRLLTYDGISIGTITPPTNFIKTVWSIDSYDPDGSGPLTPSLFIGNEYTAVGSDPTAVNASQGLARYGCAIEWARCFADTTQDLRVSMLDITTVLSNWGSGNPVIDTNNDGIVGMTDISAVLTTFGEDCNDPVMEVPADRAQIGSFQELQRRLSNYVPPVTPDDR